MAVSHSLRALAEAVCLSSSFLERAFLVLAQADSIHFVGHLTETRKRKGKSGADYVIPTGESR